MEIRNELRYLLSVGLWERMAADGLLTKEELGQSQTVVCSNDTGPELFGNSAGYSRRGVVWFRCRKRWKEANEKWLKYK